MKPTLLTCDWMLGCTAPVTHIDPKGYVYCEAHAFKSGRGRPMTRAELALLAEGKPLPSYSKTR